MDEFRLHERMDNVERLLRQSLRVQKRILAAILKHGGPPTPTGFDVRETKIPTGEQIIMKATNLHATVNLQILENGQVRYTLTPTPPGSVIPAGTPPVVGTSSDPNMTLAIDTPNDPTGFGLVQLGTAGNAASTGIVAHFETTLPGASAPISADADPVDVVPAPPGSPTGFVIQEAAV